MRPADGRAMIDTERSSGRGHIVFHWRQHPTQIEIWIEDVDLDDAFTEAMMALGDVLTEERGGVPVMHDVSVAAPDVPKLLAEWLNALARLAAEEGFIAERVVRMDLADTRLDARVGGQRLVPRHVVKGATCHELEMKSDHLWRAHVVLDL
jgi:SHS2 domain-containing protein